MNVPYMEVLWFTHTYRHPSRLDQVIFGQSTRLASSWESLAMRHWSCGRCNNFCLLAAFAH